MKLIDRRFLNISLTVAGVANQKGLIHELNQYK